MKYIERERPYSERGFTIIELLVVMVILVVALALSADSFIRILRQSRQQSKIAETKIEHIVGLEMLRRDIEHAGMGLPWFVYDIDGDGDYTNDWASLDNYLEAASYTVCSTLNINTLNDAPSDAPRAFVGSDGVCDGSDYLVIKSTAVRNHQEARKWTFMYDIYGDGSDTDYVNYWGTQDDLESNTTVIVIKSKLTKTVDRALIPYLDGSVYKYYLPFNFLLNEYELAKGETLLVFGIGDDQALRMPFNRADYYLNYNQANLPTRCAPGTGVLLKNTISHTDGQFGEILPLLDCVADFQVIFGLDMNENGIVGTYSNPDGSGIVNSGLDPDESASLLDVQSTLADASSLRKSLKEVRIYILAHEGQKDRNFTFTQSTITVGEFGLGRDVDLTQLVGNPEYRYYRWKVYTMVVKPENLID